MKKQQHIVLNTAFLIESAFNQQIDASSIWFSDFCDILKLSDQEKNRIFNDINNKQVKEIKKIPDYMRYCRIKQYDAMLDNSVKVGDEYEVIQVKGDSLIELHKIEEDEIDLYSSQKRISMLESKANEGYVIAKFVVGLAYYNGICVEKNEEKAIELLTQSSNWGHTLSMIYLCSINRQYREDNKNFVYAALNDTPYKELISTLYGKEVKAQQSCEYAILKELFSNKAIESYKYDYLYAKVLFDKHIKPQDKNSLLNGCSRETVAKASILPTYVKEGVIDFDMNVFEGTENAEEITKTLRNADVRMYDAYKPLCIQADSTFMIKKYVDLIKEAYRNSKVEVIELDLCTSYELESTCNNVFVTSCEKDENNVIIIVCQGKNIPYETLKQAKNFAIASSRKQFKLLQPTVTLDLVGALPIYVCDEYNYKNFKENCNVIQIQSKPDDKKTIVYDSIEKKRNCYGIDKISVSNEAVDKIASLDIDTIDSLLDKVIIGQRNGSEPISLSVEIISQAIKNKNSDVRCGFN